MRKSLGKPLTFISALSVLAALPALPACVADDGPAFFISGNVAASGDCTYETGGNFLTRGAFDVSVGTGYLMNPVFNSQLVNRAATAPPRANPNGVLITGAEVELLDAAGNTINFGGLPNPFTVASTAYVPTSSGPTSPGQAVGTFEVIPPAYLAGLGTARMLVLVSFKAFGQTTGGVDIDVSEFTWPVDVCSGCLLVVAGPDDETGCCAPVQDGICYFAP